MATKQLCVRVTITLAVNDPEALERAAKKIARKFGEDETERDDDVEMCAVTMFEPRESIPGCDVIGSDATTFYRE
jgi:hypothetical protein